MELWCKSSAHSVYKHTRREENDHAALLLHSAKNMTVWGQVLLRDSMSSFDITGITVGEIPADIRITCYAQDYTVYNDGIPYPDILSPCLALHVLPNVTQALWLCVEVSSAAAEGSFTVPYTVHTSLGEYLLSLTLHVHRAVLPEPKDSAFGHEYFFSISGFGADAVHPVTPFYSCEMYSEEWWQLMTAYAHRMKELRVNSLYVNALTLLKDSGSRKTGEGEWDFSFTLLDRFVAHFLKHGSFRYLTLTAVVASADGTTISSIDEMGRGCHLEIFTPDADAWAEALFTALYRHFSEKGWLSMLRLHLQDEPHVTKYWKWARAHCRACMPNVPCGEPIDTCGIGSGLGEDCNIYIPRLEVYDTESAFYQTQQTAGREVWCYSCCYPEEPWWLNKFIDLPHRYARLIHWACFSQGITGFLHWGFNFWGNDSLYGLQPSARFKGDGFIVYPDVAHNDVMMSNRGMATAEGLAEWELLYQLSEKDRSAAKALSGRVARTFRDFEKDPFVLDSIRTELLIRLDALL